MATFEIPFQDFAGYPSTVSLEVDDAVLDATLTAIFASVEGMSVGQSGQSTLKTSVDKDAGPGGFPANGKAQREAKWLCTYHNAVTPAKEYTLEIPCPDFALQGAGVDTMDLTAGAGLAFKTQFDAFVKAPDNLAQAVVLDEALLLGRNL